MSSTPQSKLYLNTIPATGTGGYCLIGENAGDQADVGFRDGSARFVILFTDASFHQAGDGLGEDFPGIAQMQGRRRWKPPTSSRSSPWPTTTNRSTKAWSAPWAVARWSP